MRLAVETVSKAIEKYLGNITKMAESLGVARATVYSFCDSHPELKELLTQARQSMVDNVESRFYSDCLADSAAYQTSRIFFLKTQAKDRGYVEREEHTGKDGAPLGFDMSKLTYEQLAAIRKIIEDSPATSPESE